MQNMPDLRIAAARTLAAVGIALTVTVPVAAQSGDPGPTSALPEQQQAEEADREPLRVRETVEVTATRGAVDAVKSPASSTVVTRAEIERRNAVTVDQALGEIEGLAVYRTRGLPDNGVGIGMRGFSGRSSGQSRVLVLLDGQPINDPYLGAVNWTAVPVDEVDRVEVVRGPFSALYGGNAMGGVVNVLTRPVDRRLFEASAQYGTYDTGSVSARFSDRFMGRLGTTLAYGHLRTAGYRAQTVVRPATASTLFSAGSLLDETSDVTLFKQTSTGELEIITKKGPTITVQKATDRSMSGQGVRLGTAYRLSSGEVIYVPEGEAAP